jgi:hypothetical protein
MRDERFLLVNKRLLPFAGPVMAAGHDLKVSEFGGSWVLSRCGLQIVCLPSPALTRSSLTVAYQALAPLMQLPAGQLLLPRTGNAFICV